MASSNAVRTANKWDVNVILADVREADAAEVWASHHLPIEEALTNAYNYAVNCWTILRDDQPVAMFGVTAPSLLSTTGAPWLVGTSGFTKMLKESRYFIKFCHKYIKDMAAPFEMLENWVDQRNLVSKRWLKWCGFTIEKPEPYGPDNLPFHRFWMRSTSWA